MVFGSASLALPSSVSRRQPSGVNAGIHIGTYIQASGHTHLTRSLAAKKTPDPAGTIVIPPACSKCNTPLKISTHSANSGRCHASLHASFILATQAERPPLLLATFPKYSVIVRSGALTTSTDFTTVGVLRVLCAGGGTAAVVVAPSSSRCSVSGEKAGRHMATSSVSVSLE
eukprot:CAMPEP_0170885296 /NCGR_PEP_ID=MMETSP0734-20130129/35742_1 /TAXON_ID=186038 /ORGANISM="Fragilariopsis kerguelensis, Strain L26-C5" /LENGTH=171 /DNA_ID=CAMNT_0011270575 /DNA_START=86 /DNA_END=601 /DNA_ORIENTATION=+